ncbi:MAG TPA: TetR family transcriptional regulator [Kribbella sp.]|jgi:AcrR family transcriptional regulator
MANTGGLRDRKKLETWRAINIAAAELFLERGFEAVSIADIAAAANISPSTFFNYFTTKEAVVFDPDPADSSTVRDLLDARPDGEPLWDSLREALLGYLKALGPRVVTQRRLKTSSPALAACGRELGDRIHDDLGEWARLRHSRLTEMDLILLINLSTAAVLAAFEVWDPDTGVHEFVQLAADCLNRTGTGVAPSPDGKF